MSQDSKTKSPDSLTKTKGIGLAESELEKVAGGDVALTKAKTADKQQAAMDAYIKG